MNDDTIYRQAAIDAIEAYFGDLPIVVHYDMLQLIKKLPSAERRGRWIYNMNFAEPPFKCSACGKSQGKLSKYCPDCGAWMEGEEK